MRLSASTTFQFLTWALDCVLTTNIVLIASFSAGEQQGGTRALGARLF